MSLLRVVAGSISYPGNGINAARKQKSGKTHIFYFLKRRAVTVWTVFESVPLFLSHTVEKADLARAMFFFSLSNQNGRGPTYIHVCKRVCVCIRAFCSCLVLWGFKSSLNSFDWQHSPAIAVVQPSSTSFLFSLSLFSLSSTSFVSLCFTLCLHITLWVVQSYNIWSFSGRPLSGICLL